MEWFGVNLVHSEPNSSTDIKIWSQQDVGQELKQEFNKITHISDSVIGRMSLICPSYICCRIQDGVVGVHEI